MRVDWNNCRTPDEEYYYWHFKYHSHFDPKLPWEMHPNETKMLDRYKEKMRSKMRAALDLIELSEHTLWTEH